MKYLRRVARLHVTILLLALAAPAALAQVAAGPEPSAPEHAVRGADLPLLRLDELLQDAAALNPSLRDAYLEADALATRSDQVSALPDPMVMGTYQPFSVLTARGPQRSQWRAEQQIPFPGKLSLKGEIADLSAEVAGREAAAYEQDLLVEVKRTYYELHRIQEQRRLTELFQARLSDFERSATSQYEVGTGMQQAVLKAQVEKNTLSQRLAGLREQRQTAMETLSRLTNRPIEGDYEVRVGEMERLLLLEDEALVELARRYRPELEALNIAEQRAERQVALARKEFLPDFNVNLTYFDIASSDMPPTANGRDAVALGIGVKVPLQRGRLRAQVEEAQVRANQVAARQEALATRFDTEIADLTSQIRREREQMALYRDLLIPQAETTVEATLSAYTTGRTDFLNLLDAERMLFSLRMGYEDTYVRHAKAVAGLERALGVSSLNDVLQAQR